MQAAGNVHNFYPVSGFFQNEKIQIQKPSWVLYRNIVDGSRLISVVLRACFEQRNRDSGTLTSTPNSVK